MARDRCDSRGGEYLKTMGMRLLRGRMLDAHDTEKASKVLVVSETMVKQLWPGADAIDQCVRVTGSADQSAEGVWRSLPP